MRIWSLHPRYLDRQGLTACWREGLLAQAVLAGRTRGYRQHSQLERFRAQPDPVAAVGAYLEAVAREAADRGYRFDVTRIDRTGPPAGTAPAGAWRAAPAAPAVVPGCGRPCGTCAVAWTGPSSTPSPGTRAGNVGELSSPQQMRVSIDASAGVNPRAQRGKPLERTKHAYPSYRPDRRGHDWRRSGRPPECG